MPNPDDQDLTALVVYAQNDPVIADPQAPSLVGAFSPLQLLQVEPAAAGVLGKCPQHVTNPLRDPRG